MQRLIFPHLGTAQCLVFFLKPFLLFGFCVDLRLTLSLCTLHVQTGG